MRAGPATRHSPQPKVGIPLARESGLTHSGSDVALEQPTYDDRVPAASRLKVTIEQIGGGRISDDVSLLEKRLLSDRD